MNLVDMVRRMLSSCLSIRRRPYCTAARIHVCKILPRELTRLFLCGLFAIGLQSKISGIGRNCDWHLWYGHTWRFNVSPTMPYLLNLVRLARYIYPLFHQTRRWTFICSNTCVISLLREQQNVIAEQGVCPRKDTPASYHIARINLHKRRVGNLPWLQRVHLQQQSHACYKYLH